jgi:transcription termination factor Rho
MTERRRPPRRGRGARPRGEAAPDAFTEADPYRDASEHAGESAAPPAAPPAAEAAPAPAADTREAGDDRGDGSSASAGGARDNARETTRDSANARQREDRGERGDRPERNGRGRRGRRPRGRGRDRGDTRGENRGDARDREPGGGGPPVILVVDGETTGWFDPARDAGFIRRAEFSYLNEPGDAWVPTHLVRQYGLRRGDALVARTGRDHRGRLSVAEIVSINGEEPNADARRPDFQTLTASYPERRSRSRPGGRPRVAPSSRVARST